MCEEDLSSGGLSHAEVLLFISGQLELTQLPRWVLSCQQEQLPQVPKCEDHQATQSPASRMSSEDLAPYLGERWKREDNPQVPAEVGM